MTCSFTGCEDQSFASRNGNIDVYLTKYYSIKIKYCNLNHIVICFMLIKSKIKTIGNFYLC